MHPKCPSLQLLEVDRHLEEEGKNIRPILQMTFVLVSAGETWKDWVRCCRPQRTRGTRMTATSTGDRCVLYDESHFDPWLCESECVRVGELNWQPVIRRIWPAENIAEPALRLHAVVRCLSPTDFFRTLRLIIRPERPACNESSPLQDKMPLRSLARPFSYVVLVMRPVFIFFVFV